MSRYIDTDELSRAKFHPLPYTHIIPADIKDVEAYERGWNDAIDAIIESAPTADVMERKHGKWEMKWHSFFRQDVPCCSVCHKCAALRTPVCPNCGARMEGTP